MRWERLFDELEARSSDLELEERDILAAELRDGEWSETSWRSLLGGSVVLEVAGHGRVEGEVLLVNEHLVQLRGDRRDLVVACSAVLTVMSASHRADEATEVTSRLGWGHVFRTLRTAVDEIRVHLVDGSPVDGMVTVVGRDFVRLRSESGRDQLVPFGAVAMVSGRT